MTNDTPDLDQLVTSLAAVVGLPIDPAHRPDVALNLGRLLAEARVVMGVPLTAGTEPAPVFRP